MNMRAVSLFSAVALTLPGCAPAPRDPVAQAVVNIAASPFYIAGAIVHGLTSLPMYLAADWRTLDTELSRTGSSARVARTHRVAFGQTLYHPTSATAVVGANETTPAPAARSMKTATTQFRKVLADLGVPAPESYVLTAVRSADQHGYTLYAVVHRPQGDIVVRPEASLSAVRLTPDDDRYYMPWAKDAAGNTLDVIIDWSGVARTAIRTRTDQAVLMTIAAKSVLENRRTDNYWAAERRWRAGGFKEIVRDARASIVAKTPKKS